MTTKTTSEPPLIGLAEIHILPGQYIVRYRDRDRNNNDDAIITKAVSPETLRAAFMNERIDSGWLDPRVRRWGHAAGGQFAVLFVPAQKHVLRLTNLSKALSGNGRAKIEVALPGFVFAGLGKRYAAWAVTGQPLPGALACHAPLPNVHDSGEICWGNNVPPACAPETISVAWQMFITSPFNNHLMGGSSQEFDQDVREQLWRTAQARARAYPVSDLVTTGKTIHTVVPAFLRDEGCDDD